MRKALQRIALGLAVALAAWWLLTGAHRGWTKTTVTRWQKDPVTDIEGPVIEKRFVPGLDLLALGLAGAAALYLASFFVAKSGIPTIQSKR